MCTSLCSRVLHSFHSLFQVYCNFLPLFHLISSRTHTNRSHLESFPCCIVPHFVCLHFISGSGKAIFTTRLQSESSCCCLRQCTAPDCVCVSEHLHSHIQVCRTHTYTCSHPRTTLIYTSSLTLLLRRSFLCRCFFILTCVFSVVCGQVVNLKICSMKMFLFYYKDSYLTHLLRIIKSTRI